MGYILEAVIGSESRLRKAILDQPAAVVVPLRQGIAMVPMTDKLFSAVTDGSSERPLGFWKLPGGFERYSPPGRRMDRSATSRPSTSEVTAASARRCGRTGRWRPDRW